MAAAGATHVGTETFAGLCGADEAGRDVARGGEGHAGMLSTFDGQCAATGVCVWAAQRCTNPWHACCETASRCLSGRTCCAFRPPPYLAASPAPPRPPPPAAPRAGPGLDLAPRPAPFALPPPFPVPRGAGPAVQAPPRHDLCGSGRWYDDDDCYRVAAAVVCWLGRHGGAGWAAGWGRLACLFSLRPPPLLRQEVQGGRVLAPVQLHRLFAACLTAPAGQQLVSLAGGATLHDAQLHTSWGCRPLACRIVRARNAEPAVSLATPLPLAAGLRCRATTAPPSSCLRRAGSTTPRRAQATCCPRRQTSAWRWPGGPDACRPGVAAHMRACGWGRG